MADEGSSGKDYRVLLFAQLERVNRELNRLEEQLITLMQDTAALKTQARITAGVAVFVGTLIGSVSSGLVVYNLDGGRQASIPRLGSMPPWWGIPDIRRSYSQGLAGTQSGAPIRSKSE